MTRDEAVLAYNPWGYDDSPYRTLRDGMATTRTPHKCAICMQPIQPGSRVRAKTEVLDGKIETFRFCPPCCEAMADVILDIDPDGEAIERRTQIGMGLVGLRAPRV